MIRERHETIAFSRDDIERIVRHIAKQQITDSSFLGKFGEQFVRWTGDGGIEVISTYQGGSLEDVPPMQQPMAVIALTKKKKK